MARLPIPGSRSDLTRKAVLHAIAKARRLGLVGKKGSASAILRVGQIEARPARIRGGKIIEPEHKPFSRASLYRYGGSAFRRIERGQRTDRLLKGSDRIRRRIDVFSNQRGVEIGSIVHGSADASKVAQHHRAMHLFLSTGDPDYLLRLSEADRTLSDGRVLVGDPDEVQQASDEGRLDDFRQDTGS